MLGYHGFDCKNVFALFLPETDVGAVAGPSALKQCYAVPGVAALALHPITRPVDPLDTLGRFGNFFAPLFPC